jgi:hypothetical protein
VFDNDSSGIGSIVEILREERERMARSLENIRERSMVHDATDITRENEGDGMGEPLLSPNMTVPPPFSHESETEKCSCC